MATIRDVAREAGVSPATVSRVINKYPLVSQEAKDSVEAAIKKLKYEPNMLGRNLRQSKSGMILALMPSISNPFYSEIVRGIEDVVRQKGYSVFICGTDFNIDKENTYLTLLKQKLVDGVIIMKPVQDVAMLSELADVYPIVQCSEYSEDFNLPYVSIDNRLASYEAVKHLIYMGHENIALINSDEKFLYARRRKEGYIKALEEFEIKIRQDLIIHAGLGFDKGRRAVRKLMMLKNPPTAIFAVSDTLAIGAIKELGVMGISVPKSVAVVGFDNIEFSNMVTPSLTTIAQPMYDIGKESVKILIKRIKNIHEPVDNVILNHELIVRESSMR